MALLINSVYDRGTIIHSMIQLIKDRLKKQSTIKQTNNTAQMVNKAQHMAGQS